MDVMTDRIRIIRHEGVKDSGSFEVRFADDRPPRYFYWDDVREAAAAVGDADQRTGAGAGQGIRSSGAR